MLGLALAAGCGGGGGGGGTPNTLVVEPPNNSALPPASVGLPYSATIKVISGGTAPYTFRPVSLPQGLTLVPQGASEATLSGTPATVGSMTVSVQVVDATNSKTANQSYGLSVN